MIAFAMLAVVGTLDAAAIQQALAGKDAPDDSAYILNDSLPVVLIQTPYARVYAAGLQARKEYREIKATDIPVEVTAPTFSAHFDAYLLGGDPVSITHAVVITPDGKAVQPISKESVPKEWSNAFGRTKNANGLTATFPISALVPGSEIRALCGEVEQQFQISRAFLDRIR